jgi:hypothetical protein
LSRLEERLHDSLGRVAADAPGFVGEWARVRHRAMLRRRRRVAAIIGVVVAVAASGLGLLLSGGNGSQRVVAGPSSVTPRPASVIAHLISPLGVGYASQVVELSSTNGQIRHVLAPVPGGIVAYAITADEQTVYLDGFNEQGGIPCPGQAKALTSLLRVPLHGGQPVLEATGARPALSPDKTRLAYLRAECGTRNQNFVPMSLAVRQLGTGTEHVWSLPPPYADGNSFGFENIGPLEWAADGAHLLTRVVSGGQLGAPASGTTSWWFVDATAPSGPLRAVQLTIPSGPQGPLPWQPRHIAHRLPGSGRWHPAPRHG